MLHRVDEDQRAAPCGIAGARPYHQRMDLVVECSPGHRGEPEPLAFAIGTRRLAVLAIVDRWFAPGSRWYKVEADDGDTYILRHDAPEHRWSLAAFTSAARSASPGS
jgi:hypothetical protein